MITGTRTRIDNFWWYRASREEREKVLPFIIKHADGHLIGSIQSGESGVHHWRRFRGQLSPFGVTLSSVLNSATLGERRASGSFDIAQWIAATGVVTAYPILSRAKVHDNECRQEDRITVSRNPVFERGGGSYRCGTPLAPTFYYRESPEMTGLVLDALEEWNLLRTAFQQWMTKRMDEHDAELLRIWRENENGEVERALQDTRWDMYVTIP